jgi:hypothetical protein
MVDAGSSDKDHLVSGFVSFEEWVQAAQQPVTHEEVRRALANFRGSLSDEVFAEREEC